MNNRPSSVVPGPSSSSSVATTTGNLSHHHHHQQQQQQQHWSCEYRSHTLTHLARLLPDETVLQNVLSEAVSGGSEYGQLIVISADLFRANWLDIEVVDGDEKDPGVGSAAATADPAQKNNHKKFLAILDVDGRPVSGFTRRDFLAWLIHRLLHHHHINHQQQTDITSGGGVQLTTAPLTGQHSFSPKTKQKNKLRN